MRKLKAIIACSAGLILIAWLTLGFIIWSRNRVPALNLPPRPSLPAANAYSDYTALIKSVDGANEIFQDAIKKKVLTSGEKSAIVRRNEEILAGLRKLAGRPSVVTELEPGVEFVAARDFPNVAILATWKAQGLAAADPGASLNTLVDSLYFAEGSGRDGAFLHLTTAFTCYVPLFVELDGIVSRVPPADCALAAERVRSLIESQGRRDEIVRNERRARIRQMTTTFPDPFRGFKLKAFGDDYAWDYVMKPKAPTLTAMNEYFRKWESQASGSFSSIQLPEAFDEGGMMMDSGLSPEDVRKMLLRHYYKDARLRVLYAALKARAAGFPASLDGVVSKDLLADPFTSSPLTYTGTTVYSAGPDGKDSGGTPLEEKQLQTHSQGDLVLRIR